MKALNLVTFAAAKCRKCGRIFFRWASQRVYIMNISPGWNDCSYEYESVKSRLSFEKITKHEILAFQLYN